MPREPPLLGGGGCPWKKLLKKLFGKKHHKKHRDQGLGAPPPRLDDGYGNHAMQEKVLQEVAPEVVAPIFDLVEEREEQAPILDEVQDEQIEQEVEPEPEPEFRRFDNSKYEKGTVLGSGGQGEVRSLKPLEEGGSPLVLKTAHNEVQDRLLLQEARTYEKLGEHENIVGYEGVGEGGEPDLPGLALEYLPTSDLTTIVARLKSAYEDRTITHEEYWGTLQYLLRGVTSGVQHMGSKGLVHGDLKYQNVGLDDDMTPKLFDFGGSVPVGGRAPMNTIENLTPEWTNGAPAPENHDIYAIGQMAYGSGRKGLHAGVKDNRTETIQARKDEYEKGKEGNWDPFGERTAYDRFLTGTLAPVPEDRFTSEKALDSEFLTDALLDDKGAKGVLQRMKGEPTRKVTDEPSSEGDLVKRSKEGREGRLKKIEEQEPMKLEDSLKTRPGPQGGRDELREELLARTSRNRRELDLEAEVRAEIYGEEGQRRPTSTA